MVFIINEIDQQPKKKKRKKKIYQTIDVETQLHLNGRTIEFSVQLNHNRFITMAPPIEQSIQTVTTFI